MSATEGNIVLLCGMLGGVMVLAIGYGFARLWGFEDPNAEIPLSKEQWDYMRKVRMRNRAQFYWASMADDRQARPIASTPFS